MTKLFDDNARKKYEQQQTLFNELEYNGFKVKNMKVTKVSSGFARPYIAKYHYSQTMPDSTLYVYAGWYGDKLAGIICFGMGAGKNQFLFIDKNVKNGEYIELTRLWSPDCMPRNTESKLISTSIKMLPKDIKFVLSFADDSKNHKGYVYQATNFNYLGINKGGKMLITEDGITKHPRLLGVYRMRHNKYKKYSNKELMKELGYKYINGGCKHRYLFIRGNKNEKKRIKLLIKDKIKPYPKLLESKRS